MLIWGTTLCVAWSAGQTRGLVLTVVGLDIKGEAEETQASRVLGRSPGGRGEPSLLHHLPVCQVVPGPLLHHTHLHTPRKLSRCPGQERHHRGALTFTPIDLLKGCKMAYSLKITVFNFGRKFSSLILVVFYIIHLL